MKLTMLSAIAVAIIMVMSNCDDPQPSSDRQLNQKQEALMQEANAQVGMPGITNFTQRRQLKMIQELCDQSDLICYAYIVAEMTGKLVFIGKCIGFGIPYSTEYTNPMKIVQVPASGGGYVNEVVPQADPNGLFMPASAEGTWIMLIGPDGNPHPTYVEPRVIVSQIPLGGEK